MNAADQRTEVGLAASALTMTTAIAIAAKIAGVVIAPGARGVFGEQTILVTEAVTGTLAYTLTGLLIALICGASFELARVKRPREGGTRDVITRGLVVAVSGLIVALASPAVVERLTPLPSLALSVVTSLAVLAAGLAVFRDPKARATSVVLILLASAALFRSVAWEMSAASFERGSAGMHDLARVSSTVSVAMQGIAVLVAAAWVGTRSRWRGRILANGAIVLAFLVTWLAAGGGDAPASIESMLRASLPAAASFTPTPYALGSIAVFLVPASILLALVTSILREESPLITAPLGLALLSGGVLDVPLHALLATAAAQWALLAFAQRLGDQQPMSAPSAPLIVKRPAQ